ncbi:iron-hydroxamate transporter ATP-binding protein [Tistrella bauzanensis]|uniref:Iron-hydroxamate transporter ATP-binding protein n=1 Tax=Tistrella bauzanensis TaxID=657419 RepID=A0ABQ1IND9_9PROT|nr:ATP-binding cassette domain-containing protein [Tistrella bauzanensis]GGB48276.1 iron-hydroxamate transporter ATP-binding protein [Tistrella bauzanensis]
MSFEAEGLGVTVGGRVLLADVDLGVAGGRVLGLIGHNGSGKSTLLRLLARQITPTAGTVRLEGRALSAWGDRAFGRKVAYLPQQPPTAAGMTVRELVRLGRYPWHGALGRFGSRDQDRVDEAMALTDVTGFADRMVDSLSGGERQRVWLAMLVAQDSAYMLLDEPISALDIAHQVEILDLVRRLARLRGLGVVIILHDINMAARFCDDILALKAGRVLVRGTPETLMTEAELARIFGLRMGILPHPAGGAPLGFVY